MRWHFRSFRSRVIGRSWLSRSSDLPIPDFSAKIRSTNHLISILTDIFGVGNWVMTYILFPLKILFCHWQPIQKNLLFLHQTSLEQAFWFITKQQFTFRELFTVHHVIDLKRSVCLFSLDLIVLRRTCISSEKNCCYSFLSSSEKNLSEWLDVQTGWLSWWRTDFKLSECRVIQVLLRATQERITTVLFRTNTSSS